MQSGTGPQTEAGDVRTKRTGDGDPRVERAAAEARSFGQPASQNRLTEEAAALPLAMQARHLELLSRRGHAVADYWGELACAGQPGDVIKANSNYWSRFLQDYLGAAAGDVQQAQGLVTPQRPH
jgi:hypothetical protein